MRRGGWRKRAAEGDGWGIWGGYMSAKVKKLEDQFRSESAIQHQRDANSSSIFSGVAIYVNGLTDPSADELRRLMMLHGGQYHVYYSRSKTTHIIATNLPNAKIKELKGEKVVRPEWIVESTEEHSLVIYSISVNGIPDDVLLCRSVGENQCSGCRGSKSIEHLCAHHVSAI